MTVRDDNAQQIIETDEDHTLDCSIVVVEVTGPGVTLKMPAKPQYGERHSLIATGGAVKIDGNGHPIVGAGGYIPEGSFIDLIFSLTNTWVPSFSSEFQTLRGVRVGGLETLPTDRDAGTLWSSGKGDPNGVVKGSPGDLYSDTSGKSGMIFYVKESGIGTDDGWVPK